MHKLLRQVRFSINPFLAKDSEGFNSFSSNPSGEGLSLYFDLGVGLAGQAEMSTGFVVNVTEIDKSVRKFVIPLFASSLREAFRAGKHIGFSQIIRLLRETYETLSDKFEKVMLNLNIF